MTAVEHNTTTKKKDPPSKEQSGNKITCWRLAGSILE